MKQIYRISMTAALIVAAASCSKEDALKPDTGALTGGYYKITASVDGSTKTVLDGTNVLWATSDELQVFDNECTKVTFHNELSSPAASTSFVTDSWTGDEKYPIYATFSSGTSTSCTVGGVITTRLSNSQTVFYSNTFATKANTSVGKFDKVGGAYSAQMKNVGSLLEIWFTGDNPVTKVEVSSLGSEPVAGFVDVDYTKLVNGDTDFWTAAAGKDMYDNTYLAPSTASGNEVADADGAFKGGSSYKYYIVLLPQTYSSGLQLVMTDKDGNKAVRTVGASGGITLTRGKIRAFSKAIDDGVSFTAPAMPEKLTFDLDFTAGWPFVESVSTSSEATTGEDFTYSYVDGLYENDFTFHLTKASSGTYSYSSGNYVQWTQTGGSIRLPAIPGRYLKSVEIAITNTSAKTITMSDAATDGTILWTSPSLKDGAMSKVTFCTAGDAKTTVGDNVAGEIFEFVPKATAANTAYYIQISNGTTRFSKIKLVYSTELPSSIRVITHGFDNTAMTNDGLENPFKMDNGGVEESLRARPGANDSSSFSFWLSGQEDKKWIGITTCTPYWNIGRLWTRASNSKLKLPVITGYKLVHVDVAGGNSSSFDCRICDTRDGGGKYVNGQDSVLGGERKDITMRGKAGWTLEDDYYSDSVYYLYSSTTMGFYTVKLWYIHNEDL